MKRTIGILVAMLFCIGIASASNVVDVDMDVNSGSVDIATNGFDHSTWHPGSIGETNTFSGLGDFEGNYHASEGSYGKLNSFINVNSDVFGAEFIMTDYQDFNILSANNNRNVEGYFSAYAGGSDNVAMNLKSVGSMYVWSEATNGGIALQGNLIEKRAWTTKDDIPKSGIYLEVGTTGLASISNSAAWGWTNGGIGSSSANYNGGTRTIIATGDGTYLQQGFGANSLNFNGFDFGAGSAELSATFFGGMSGTYAMSSN